MKNYDSCCGLAGSFAVKKLDLSNKLRNTKKQSIISVNTDYVITVCPACIIGLKMALGLNSKTKVVSLLEFLNMALW